MNTDLTKNEEAIIIALLEAGIDCNSADTVEAMTQDNMCLADEAELLAARDNVPAPAAYAASEKEVEAKVEQAPKAKAPKASEHAPKREVKKVRKGTKREELLRALVAGATADEINAMCVKEDGTAWSKSAASSARGVFWRQLGYGTRIEGDRYFVTLPKGMAIEDCIIG